MATKEPTQGSKSQLTKERIERFKDKSQPGVEPGKASPLSGDIKALAMSGLGEAIEESNLEVMRFMLKNIQLDKISPVSEELWKDFNKWFISGNLDILKEVLNTLDKIDKMLPPKDDSSHEASSFRWEREEFLTKIARKAISENNPQLLSFIVNNTKFDINALDNHGYDSAGHFLERAIRSNETEIAKILIKAGIKINVSYLRNEHSPLMWAASLGEAEIVKALLEAGADPDYHPAFNNDKIENGDVYNSPTPLMLAAMTGATESARLLIEAGADINKKDYFGITPLMQALVRGHTSIVRLIIKAGANPNQRFNELGVTPLMVASAFNYQDMAKMLLEEGADASIANKFGKKALDIAKSAEMKKILEPYAHK